MKVLKQFKDVALGICVLKSDEDCFVPEMSLPLKSILQQFAYVDNIRLADLAKQGYEAATSDEDDFDAVDMDRMDIAERGELVKEAKDVIDKARQDAKQAASKTETSEQETGVNEEQREA